MSLQFTLTTCFSLPMVLRTGQELLVSKYHRLFGNSSALADIMATIKNDSLLLNP